MVIGSGVGGHFLGDLSVRSTKNLVAAAAETAALPLDMPKLPFSLNALRHCSTLAKPGPMECGLTNPARAGRQQR